MIDTNSDILLRDAFVFYRTWWEEFNDLITQGEKDLALELLTAICEYVFLDKEYEGSCGEIRRSLKSKQFLINKQAQKRTSASAGGQKSFKVSQEQIVHSILLGDYTTQAALAKDLGITPQALSKRLLNMGIKIDDKETITRLYPDLVPEQYYERENQPRQCGFAEVSLSTKVDKPTEKKMKKQKKQLLIDKNVNQHENNPIKNSCFNFKHILIDNKLIDCWVEKINIGV